MKTIALASLLSIFTLAAAVAPLPTPFALTVAGQPCNGKDEERKTARMIAALDIHEGSVVVEMGAGSGGRTIDIAKHVGATGRVYSTELGDDRLRNLRNAIEKSGAKNVTVQAAHATQTNLAEGCCDALFMENVYHHFEDPAAMNASIFRTVKPGGRVAVVDFAPDGGGEAKEPKDRDENAESWREGGDGSGRAGARGFRDRQGREGQGATGSSSSCESPRPVRRQGSSQ